MVEGRGKLGAGAGGREERERRQQGGRELNDCRLHSRLHGYLLVHHIFRWSDDVDESAERKNRRIACGDGGARAALLDATRRRSPMLLNVERRTVFSRGRATAAPGRSYEDAGNRRVTVPT